MIIRFAGDSGDGMQLTGDRFTSETATLGNDLATFPDFPAEIRAPAGSLPGVSGFQVHFADHDILTAGDRPDVLVAMNPAALKTNMADLPKGGTIIVNTDAFNDRTLQKAGYAENPIADGSLADYHVHEVALTSMTVGALKGIEGITSREAERSKNFFALGLMSWLYNRPVEGTIAFIDAKFAKRPEIVEANTKAFRAGWNYGETSEDFAVSYEVAPAPLAPGTYRQITGNTALSLRADRGLQALRSAPLPRRLSDHARLVDPRGARGQEGLRRRHLPGRGRDRGGRRGARRRLRWRARRHRLRRPGRRAQGGDDRARDRARAAAPDPRHPACRPLDRDADEAGAGRPLDGPLSAGTARARCPVVAASSPSQCFDAAIEAVRIAVKYRTPVYLLSDAYLANGSEPWLIPDVDALPDISTAFAEAGNGTFEPYRRDPDTLARPWAIPGTVGLEHRIGGLEKADVTRRHLLRPRQPRPDGATARAEGRRHRGRHPRARGRRPGRRRRAARHRVGIDVRPDRRRRAPHP